MRFSLESRPVPSNRAGGTGARWSEEIARVRRDKGRKERLPAWTPREGRRGVERTKSAWGRRPFVVGAACVRQCFSTTRRRQRFSQDLPETAETARTIKIRYSDRSSFRVAVPSSAIRREDLIRFRSSDRRVIRNARREYAPDSPEMPHTKL